MQDALQNSKSKGIASLLSKVFLIGVVIIISVLSSVFALTISLKHFLTVYLEAASLHAFFHTSKDHYK